jgi:polysaccharide export outer membrane protein
MPAQAVESVAVALPVASAAIAMPTILGAPGSIAEPAAAETRRDYAVGGGDVLRIAVYHSPDLSLDARVSERGTISYPLLGQVSVGGLSIAQVEAAIADGLRDGNFIKQPQVGVLLVQVRGNQVSVLGMANRPGRYPIEVNGMLLSELLALAGGVAVGGSEIVTLSGTRDGRPFRQRVDINALFANGAQSGNPIVSNGDTLYIDRLPNVYIYGEVQRPGPIPLMADMTLMQALASGGGLTQRGTERGLRVHRRDAAGKLQVLKPTMDDLLRPGDVVYVRESLF